MPAGQIIGRVSVKVLPDTDDFRRDAQKQLDRIEKQLKIKVAVKIDTTGLQRDLLTQIKEINAKNKTTDARKVRFYSTISTAGMNKAINDAVRELQARATGKTIKFRADDVEVTGDIKLELDQANLDKIKHDLEHWRDKVSPLKVEVKLDIANGAGAAVSARLQVLTRPRTVPIMPELDNTSVTKVATALAALSGARVLTNIFEDLGNMIKNLDKSVPVIGSLALAIAGLAGWGLTAASNLFALSSSLAQIGPAALLLPGLLGGIAVGVGTMIAAFKDFNKVLPEVKGQLSKLQDVISKNFWDKAAAPIRAMVDELLPAFTAGVAKTATQLGGFFAGLATGLKGALSPALTQMFADLSDSITIATTGTGAFANIIAVLGKVGTSYLPELAQWFVNISTRFSDFLTAAETDGRLQGWIDVALQNLKDLGSVLSNLGGIFAGLGRAAQEAGGSTLGMLADTLQSIHQTVDSPTFQSGLVDTFKAAHAAMSNLATGSGPAVKQLFITLGETLTAVLPQVGTILGTAIGAIANALSQPAVTDGLKLMFSGIQDAVNALAPAMVPLGQALGSLMSLVASFATTLGPLVAGALVPLAMAFQALVPSITPLIGLLGGALLGIIQQLTPVINELVPIVQNAMAMAFQALAAILPPIASIFGQLLTAVAPLVEQLVNALAPILPILAQALSTIMTALSPIISVLLQIVTAILTPLITVLQAVLSAVLPKLGEAIARVADALQPFLQALLAIVNFIMPILVPVITFLVNILANSLVAAINGVGLVLEGLKEVFVGIWNYIKGFFEVWWGLFEGIFTGNWDTFKQGFSDLWDGILGFLKGIWDVILGALEFFLNIGILGTAKKALVLIKDGFVAGWTLIKTVVVDLWESLGSRFTSFMTTLKNTPGAFLSEIKALFKGAWDDIKAAVIVAWDGIKNGVSQGITAVVDFVTGLPGQIISVFAGAGQWLLDIGRKIIDGLINGIKEKIGKVKDTLKGLTDMLPDWKGPESLDRVLLKDAGRLIIDGFIDGLESRYDAVRKSLKGLTEDVAGTEFDSPTIGQINTARRASNASARALAGLSTEGGVTKVLNYYAAPGSSLGSEEDLFAAVSRGRMAGW
ncbi:hypothetical protein AB0D08_00425 [Kitasatospora sp. NPDC048540]|uniref:phage tail protein n=1 Tax=Kitasatospora sp. NPDC048540 TaxID=3155634 RepID=UPI0034063539